MRAHLRLHQRPRTATTRAASRALTGSEAGMTMVELMVAISVIAIIMSGLALSIGVNYKAVALSRARQVAESAANKRLEELRDVDYADMALDVAPFHSTDPDNPDYWVSTNGVNYDVTGTGQNEELIIGGGVQHFESPVTIGTTVVDIYQYVTWVDDPAIAGTQNLKRLSVVVKYQTTPTVGGAKILRESVVLTNGTVELGSSSGTTTTSSSTTTTSSPTTTTTTVSACGTFAIAGSSGASIGYTSSTTVTITMALSGCGSDVKANFSNDGGITSWSSDYSYSSSSTTLAWTLDPGDGTKTVSGRARDGSSSPTMLNSRSIVLDTTKPTTPGSLSRSLSCSGTTRTVNLSWAAASDTHLVGYHVYRSTNGVSWVLLKSTAFLNANDTNSKSLTSVRYYVTAYDAAGNDSNASSTISLAKNQCS